MDIKNLLRSHGLKVTKPRASILKILFEAQHALDAETIRDEADKRNLYINLSTVYRTLDLFEEIHVVERIDLGENRNSFVFKKDHHMHSATCEVCHKEVDLDCPMAKIEELISKETGFSIMEHHLELKGICRDCTRGNSKAV